MQTFRFSCSGHSAVCTARRASSFRGRSKTSPSDEAYCCGFGYPELSLSVTVLLFSNEKVLKRVPNSVTDANYFTSFVNRESFQQIQLINPFYYFFFWRIISLRNLSAARKLFLLLATFCVFLFLLISNYYNDKFGQKHPVSFIQTNRWTHS